MEHSFHCESSRFNCKVKHNDGIACEAFTKLTSCAVAVCLNCYRRWVVRVLFDVSEDWGVTTSNKNRSSNINSLPCEMRMEDTLTTHAIRKYNFEILSKTHWLNGFTSGWDERRCYGNKTNENSKWHLTSSSSSTLSLSTTKLQQQLQLSGVRVFLRIYLFRHFIYFVIVCECSIYYTVLHNARNICYHESPTFSVLLPLPASHPPSPVDIVCKIVGNVRAPADRNYLPLQSNLNHQLRTHFQIN